MDSYYASDITLYLLLSLTLSLTPSVTLSVTLFVTLSVALSVTRSINLSDLLLHRLNNLSESEYELDCCLLSV